VLRSAIVKYILRAVFVLFACCLSHAQTPNITSISPNPGGIGESITITGTNFGSSGTVKFQGNLTASTTSWTSTAIIATVPVGAVTGSVVVTSGGHTSNAFSFTLNNGPVNYIYDNLGRLTAVIDVNGNAAEYSYDIVGNILSIARFTSTQVSIIDFTPQTGPVGTAVTINGTGFSATPSQNTVKFNGTAATVSSATNTQLQVTVPTAATTGTISVQSPNGSAASTTNFSVTPSSGIPTITSFSPTSGIANTPVTVIGTNFDLNAANDKLRLNASQATVGNVTSTTIPTTVPASTASGHFSLLEPEGNAISSQDFYVPFLTHVPGDIGFTARITAGGSLPVTLAASKIALVLFDGIEGQHFDVTWTGSNFSTCNLYLIAPNNSTTSTVPCNTVNGDLGSTYLPMSGTYTIGIDPGTSSGGLTLALSQDVLGTILINGPSVPVTTTAAGQDARLTFYATAGLQINVAVTNVSNPLANVVVLAPDGTIPASVSINNNPSGQNFSTGVQTLNLSGTYELWVQHSNSNIGSETLQITSVPDVTAQIAIDGQAVPVTTTLPGQDARLNFSASAGQRIFVTISNVSNPDAAVWLVIPGGTTQGSSVFITNNPSGQMFFMDTQNLPWTGPYQLWVQHTGTAVGGETLQISSVPADFPGTLTVPTMGGTTGTALQVPTSGNLAVGQNASLMFYGTAQQQLSFTLKNITIGSSPTACYLTISDPNKTVISGNNACGTGSSGYVDTLTLGLTGYYTVFIDPQQNAVGSLSIAINNAQDVTTPTISIGGSAVTATTTVPGQDVRLSFTPTSSERIAELVNNVTNPYATLNLWSSPSTIASISIDNNPSGQTFFLDTQPVNQSQVYELWVQHSGANFGKENLQIAIVPADLSLNATVGGSAVKFSTKAGQNANIQFTPNTSESIHVTWTSGTYPSSLNCYMRVTGPNGSTNQVGFGNCNAATGSINLGTLSSGQYNILVDPQAQSAGQMSLTVTTP